MANGNESIDLAAPGAGDQPMSNAAAGQQPTQPESGIRVSNPDKTFLDRAKFDDRERRWTRIILYVVVLLFACCFLWKGLNLAVDVGKGLLEAKQKVVKAITERDEVKCPDSKECVTNSGQNSKTPVQNPAKAKVTPAAAPKQTSTVDNLNTDWLSASSLIAIVAIILGVGLTLILTLLKSTYQHPTDKELKRGNDSSTIELATPLSQLIEQVIGYLKDKFSK